MNIVLIGYRGTGKTTVARLLAERLECPWWDADEEIERRAQQSIKEIFAAEGEAGFRNREVAVVADLAARSDSVLALGGGAVLRTANRQAISASVVIWLTASAATIWERVSSDPGTGQRRPNLTTAGGRSEIEALLNERDAVYRGCADHMVSTEDKTADQVADEIVCLVESGRGDTDCATA